MELDVESPLVWIPVWLVVGVVVGVLRGALVETLVAWALLSAALFTFWRMGRM